MLPWFTTIMHFKLAHFYYDVDEWELYDRLRDPQEMKNVYYDTEYSEIIKDLKKNLSALRKKYKDSVGLDHKYIMEYEQRINRREKNKNKTNLNE